MTSGSTVLVGFGALLLTPIVETRSVGLGGIVVVLFAVIVTCTLLPALLAEVEKTKLFIAPTTGEEIGALIERIYATPAHVVERAIEARSEGEDRRTKMGMSAAMTFHVARDASSLRFSHSNWLRPRNAVSGPGTGCRFVVFGPR